MKYLVFNEESETVKSIDRTLEHQTIMKYTAIELVILILFLGIFPNILIDYINSILPLVK